MNMTNAAKVTKLVEAHQKYVMNSVKENHGVLVIKSTVDFLHAIVTDVKAYGEVKYDDFIVYLHGHLANPFLVAVDNGTQLEKLAKRVLDSVYLLDYYKYLMNSVKEDLPRIESTIEEFKRTLA